MTKFKNKQILLNDISHRFLLTTKLFIKWKSPSILTIIIISFIIALWANGIAFKSLSDFVFKLMIHFAQEFGINYFIDGLNNLTKKNNNKTFFRVFVNENGCYTEIFKNIFVHRWRVWWFIICHLLNYFNHLTYMIGIQHFPNIWYDFTTVNRH